MLAASIPCPATCFINIENYYSETFNAGQYDIKGLDFTLDWFKELDNGSFMVRFLGTRTFHQKVNIVRTPFADLPATEIVGAVGNAVGFLSDYASAADFTGSLTGTWQRGNFSLTGNMRYVDDGIVEDGPTMRRYTGEMRRSVEQLVAMRAEGVNGELDAIPFDSAAGIAMHVGRPSNDVDEMPIRAPASCRSIKPPGVPVTITAAGSEGVWASGAYTVASGVFVSLGTAGTSIIRI